jgi:hypothetical protein
MHGTVKNAIETRRNIYTEYESDNLRKYLLRVTYLVISTGYYSNLPFCFNLLKNERSIDINMKAYKNMDFGTLWGGLSYRRSIDGLSILVVMV